MKKYELITLISMASATLLASCGNTSSSPVSYNGRVYDISQSQDGSLTATSTLESGSYSLLIDGSGVSVDYHKITEVPWNPIAKKINKVTFNNGIEHIGDYYFSSVSLDRYILPASVTSVGEHTFNPSATIYTFGGELNNITNEVFYYRETKPEQPGNYFYMENGEPQVYIYGSSETYNVLFIGNSFTYRGNGGVEDNPTVPNYFKDISESLGQQVNVDCVVKSSYTLAKFATPTDEKGAIVEEKLTSNQYDYIILQEQSTLPLENYNAFLNSVKTLKARIDATQTNCQTILYETWGSTASVTTTYPTVADMEAGLRVAYDNASKATGCPVNYVGKTFTYVFDNMKNINIYDTDNRHQNGYGAYLSAAVHVRSLFKLNVSRTNEYCGLENTSDCKALLGVVDKLI